MTWLLFLKSHCAGLKAVSPERRRNLRTKKSSDGSVMANYLLSLVISYQTEIVFCVLGAALPYLATFSRDALFYFFAGGDKFIIGAWNTYHFTSENDQIVLRQETWNIYRGLGVRYKITTNDVERPGLIYQGEVVSVDPLNLITRLHGTNHDEELYLRISYPIPSKKTITFGLKIGVTFDNKIFTTMYLFSRAKLSLEEADVILSKVIAKSLSHGKFVAIP